MSLDFLGKIKNVSVFISMPLLTTRLVANSFYWPYTIFTLPERAGRCLFQPQYWMYNILTNPNRHLLLLIAPHIPANPMMNTNAPKAMNR
jgi:hypothetical protein